MGKKKKKNFNKIKELIITIILVLAIFFLDRYGVFDKIDEYARQTGLAEEFNTIKNSNTVEINKVKTNEEIITNVADKITIQKDKLNILFFDVGQADSQLIIVNGKTMLIDAGNRNDGEKIVNALRAMNITKLDYVIGTHIHEDHVGGMSDIIDSFEIEKFYVPYDTKTTANYYEKMLNSLKQKNMSIEEATVGEILDLGDAKAEIMSVRNDEPENTNEQSIVIELSYFDLEYLFMGDAEIENEKAREWNDVDVLKVGHHGSNTSTSKEFIKEVLPEVSIISVGKDNSYGLPKDNILDRLNQIETKIYRTDEDGTIQIVSDGKINEIIKIDLSFDG